jgi:hypothetical protein
MKAQLETIIKNLEAIADRIQLADQVGAAADLRKEISNVKTLLSKVGSADAANKDLPRPIKA